MSVDERVFVGLGSNQGERHAQLTAALAALDALQDTRVVRVSAFVESPAWGVKDQPAFVNAVAELSTALEPEALLAELKRIETALGRTPRYAWGPREIDLDIILFGRRRIASATLTVPHRHCLERAFVMAPLAEIAPEVAAELNQHGRG
jgi:2-amino-4-hydroxy-6-hydroxymethyldihydropteridine diphosphokinase